MKRQKEAIKTLTSLSLTPGVNRLVNEAQRPNEIVSISTPHPTLKAKSFAFLKAIGIQKLIKSAINKAGEMGQKNSVGASCCGSGWNPRQIDRWENILLCISIQRFFLLLHIPFLCFYFSNMVLVAKTFPIGFLLIQNNNDSDKKRSSNRYNKHNRIYYNIFF